MAEADIQSLVLSYKYKLRPTRKQHDALSLICEAQRQLYNGCLEHRIGAYTKGVNVSLYSQFVELTKLRCDDEYRSLPLNLQRWTLRRLDDAYKAFFSRIKRGEKAGFPRFRSRSRWSTFGFSEFDGITIERNRFRFKGMPGTLRFNYHRELPKGKPLSCTFTKGVKGWTVCIQVRVPVQAQREVRRSVGVDVGLSTLAALSNGEMIARVRHTEAGAAEIRRRSRALARCKKGSKRRQKVKHELAKAHAKVASQRDTYLHQVSAKLVREYDQISVEKLNVKGLARSRLAKSVHDVAWGKLRQYLAYKAEKAGCELIEVDPAYTSQDCSGCGHRVKKTLNIRQHICSECGLSLDRDENAAINILHRGRSGSRVSQRRAIAHA